MEQNGAGEPYLPLLEAVSRLCPHPEGDRLGRMLTRSALTGADHLPGLLQPDELQALLPTVVGATPVRMMHELADAFEIFSRDHPLILSLEDVHLLKGRKHELQIHGHCQELSLEGLPEAAVTAFLTQRLRGHSAEALSVKTVVPFVYHRTERNPLFMVNVVDYLLHWRMLALEKEGWSVLEDEAATSIPTGLRQFIELRVDQLPIEDRQLLAVASVAGMDFSTAILTTASDTPLGEIEAHCETLVAQEQFLDRTGPRDWPDGTVTVGYAFRHAVYQETLYERQPLATRLDRHRRIGERLDVAYPER